MEVTINRNTVASIPCVINAITINSGRHSKYHIVNITCIISTTTQEDSDFTAE
jgi:hypothetical protein